MFKKADINRSSGISAFEVLVAVSILVAVSTFVFNSLSSFGKHNSLKFAAAKVAGGLEEARNATQSAKNDVRHGVHFETNKIVIFEGSTYSAGASSNKVILLSPGVEIASVELNGGGSDVIFDKLTGGTEQFGTTTLSITASSTASTTLFIHKTGLIEHK